MILSVFIYTGFIVYFTSFIILLLHGNFFIYQFTNYHISFYGGVCAYLILRFFVKPLRENLLFFETFQHEFTHMFFALITFKKIYNFNATLHEGGLVKMEKINPIIALSPYSLPIFTVFASLLTYIVKEKYLIVILFISGVMYMQFLLSALKDIFTVKQPDLHRYSPILSYPLVLISLITTLMFSYMLLSNGAISFYEAPITAFQALRAK